MLLQRSQRARPRVPVNMSKATEVSSGSPIMQTLGAPESLSEESINAFNEQLPAGMCLAVVNNRHIKREWTMFDTARVNG